MSIWTDLLFLGGHVATTTGLAALAPEALAPEAPAAPAPRPAPRPEEAPVLVRAVPRANRISPNSLF